MLTRLRISNPWIAGLGLAFAVISFSVQADSINHEQHSASSSGNLYESAFADYQSFKEAPVDSWREVNDRVKGGGHAGHHMPDQKPGEMDMDNGMQHTQPPKEDSMPHNHEHMMH